MINRSSSASNSWKIYVEEEEKEQEQEEEEEEEQNMRNHRLAPLPFPGFFFEGTAIFTSAAENIGNLWNEACKHGLKAGRRTNIYVQIRQQRG